MADSDLSRRISVEQRDTRASELYRIRSVTSRIPRFKGSLRLAVWLASFAQIDREAAIEAAVLGSKMMLKPHDFVDRRLFFAPQLYDWWEVSRVQRLVREGDIAIDIGAHIGFYTLLFSRLAGRTGRVLSIEATPATYRRLIENLEGNQVKNVIALNCGIGAFAGAMTIWLRSVDNTGGNSFVNCQAGSVEGPKVQILPLLDVLTDQGITNIRIAKFDVEGMEYDLLRKFYTDARSSLWPEYLLIEDLERGMGRLGKLLTQIGYRIIGGNALNQLYRLSGPGSFRPNRSSF